MNILYRDDMALNIRQFHVKYWQLIPHDSFEWGFTRMFLVGDIVQVISPLSPEYRKEGKVCNVTASSVEVIEHRSNTTVCLSFGHWLIELTRLQFAVPPWFLRIDDYTTMPAPDGMYGSYDRCKELVNTWVFVAGNHPEKSLYGRIQESIGNHKVCIEARSGARLVDIHVDYLYSP